MKRTATAVLLLFALALPAQDRPRSFGAKSYVTAIELVVDVTDSSGKTPGDLTPADFVVIEDDEQRTVVGLEYLGRDIPAVKPAPAVAGAAAQPQPQRAQADWQIVIWYDGMTTGRGVLQESAKDLRKRAAELAGMGAVTILYSDLDTKAVVTSTRDVGAINKALDQVVKMNPGDRLSKLRQQFLRQAAATSRMSVPGSDVSTVVGGVDDDISVYVAEEMRLLELGRTNMLRWIGRVPRRQPRMLMYIGGGFDLDPVDFYASAFESSGMEQTRGGQTAIAGRANDLRSENKQRLDAQNHDLARLLAAEGWLVVGVGGTGGYTMSEGVERGYEAMGDRNPVARSQFLFVAPAGPLEQYARETGGARVANVAQLPKVLERMRNRVRLTYQVDREPDLKPREITVRSLRPGLKVAAPRWASSSTAAAMMEVRALDVVDSSPRAEKGDLSIEAYAAPSSEPNAFERSGSLVARVDLTPLAAVAREIGTTKVRFTVAFNEEGGMPSFLHSVVDIPDLSKTNILEWSVPYRVPRSTEAAGIVVEELTTGAWGSIRVAFDGTFSASAGAAPEPEAPPSEWMTDRAAAVARAIKEDKLVFAYHRDPNCRPCSQLLREASSHPGVQRLASRFVLLVTPLGRPLAPGVEPPPMFGIIDATNLEVLTWEAMKSHVETIGVGGLADVLQRAEAAAPHVRRSAAERTQGKIVDALMSLAWGFRQAGDAARASEAYAAAVRTARVNGDLRKAQSAEVLLALSDATRGKVEQGIASLRAITRAPVSRRTEAEAWVALGQLLRTSGKEREAAEALDRASKLAASAPEAREAVNALLGTPERVVSGDARAVRLLVPTRAAYSGKVTAQALARNPAIASVIFVVDGSEVANDTQPPFDASIDLGDVPRRHELRVIARNAAGNVLGEDAVILNDRHDEFWVRLALGERRTATANLNLPAGGILSRVEFFLDDRVIATRTAAPFTANVAEAGEGSTLRVAATLSDGRTAEDAALVGVGGGDLIEVQEVELYATVLDARDEVIPNLDRSQFTLFEEGQPRRITGFDSDERAPFTVGLAIDSSGSMLPRMADVHESARDFLGRIASAGQRAFIVDFDSTPKLVAATTSDAAALHAGIEAIRADGSTALYDAMVFSLLQLQGVGGKRALIVLSDGKDEGSRYSVDDVVRVARESGAAIYLLVLSSSAPARLETLATESGGRVWELRDTKQLDGIYATIDRELRSQYRLTFRTDARVKDQWRKVDVRVEVPNAKVRSASGFVPR